ncbi:MAG: hypothetical protein HYV26_12420 [Candidatus Hydrogenedentes bacterium]|nr:hypothetical protein [Candidatus Hydrogenedentota bacterium]MBI3117316.1 hypothetical protein [Candidatus Hydrogenedentota bacterium]
MASEPPIYWEFDTELLPASCVLVKHPSSTGDVCHYDLTRITRGEARRIFAGVTLDHLTICLDDAAPVTPALLDRLSAQHGGPEDGPSLG